MWQEAVNLQEASAGGTLPQFLASSCISGICEQHFLTASAFLKKWFLQVALNLTLAKNCGKVPETARCRTEGRRKLAIYLNVFKPYLGMICRHIAD